VILNTTQTECACMHEHTHMSIFYEHMSPSHAWLLHSPTQDMKQNKLLKTF